MWPSEMHKNHSLNKTPFGVSFSNAKFLILKMQILFPIQNKNFTQVDHMDNFSIQKAQQFSNNLELPILVELI